MKLIVSTVREFPAESRQDLIGTMIVAHLMRGDDKLAQRLVPLIDKTDRIVISDEDASTGEWVQTVYELQP